MVAALAVLGRVVDDASSATTSTSPIERLRWKLVASSKASQRQNSIALNSDRRAAEGRWLVTVARQISRVSPSGTKYGVSTSMPARRDPMTV